MPQGKYIIIDGIEAVGKDGIGKRIREYLSERGIELQSVREPGGTQLGEMERALLKEPVLAYRTLRAVFQGIKGYDFSIEADEKELTFGRDPWAEIFEFLASRSSSAEKVILPALRDGKWIVADRAWTTTFAYQGFGRFNGERKDLRLILANHKRILKEAFPGDRIYVLDITVEESLRRMQKDLAGRTSTDLMDRQSAEFFERTREGYRALKKKYPRQVRIIDGMRTPDEIFRDIKKDLEIIVKAGGRI